MAWDYALWLYVATAAVLIVHQLDSAYRRRRGPSGVAGGMGLFLLLHLPLVALALYGLVRVHGMAASGRWFAYLLGALGLIVPVLRGGYLLEGEKESLHRISLALMAVSALLGAALVLVSFALP